MWLAVEAGRKLADVERPRRDRYMGYQWSLTLHNISRVVRKRGTGWYQFLEGAGWVVPLRDDRRNTLPFMIPLHSADRVYLK